MDDIVKRAQTSHGTFYLYFTNKEELLRALAEVTADQLAGLPGRLPALSLGPDGLTSLTDWMAEFRRQRRRETRSNRVVRFDQRVG